MGDDVWTMAITKLLLEEFDGRAKFGQFKRRLYQQNPVKCGIFQVIKRLSNSDRFLVFEKDEQVKYVSVAWEDATICFGHRKRGWDTCRKYNCSKFHVCKFFISGNCVHGSRCLFGHDLENETNKRVSDSLGLSSFSAEDIRTIIFRSHPSVCVKYNRGGCDDDDCPDLHVCSRFMLQKCTAGAGCILGHSLQTTEHNQWVLDSFYLEDLNDEELRRRILVINIPNTDTHLRSQMTPATSSLSLFSPATSTSAKSSTSSIDTEDYIVSVVSFLLKRFGGRVKFNTFLTERGSLLQGLRRVDIIEWLKDNSDRFLLHESDDDVKYVSVHNTRARLCFRYRNPGDSMCDNQFCKYFHVCIDRLTDTCIRTRCHLNHDFSSWPNAKICSDLNLHQFSDNEICKLILCSNPVVCVNHNKSGCHLNDCPDLHVCSKNILNQCARGDGCKFGHTIKNSGEHNLYVLKAFRMDTWQEKVLRRLAIVKKERHPETLAYVSPIEIIVEPDTPPSGRKEYTHHLTKPIGVKDTDPGAYEYLCEAYTWTGRCPRTPNCPWYHSPERIPYLWLTGNQKDGQWHRVSANVNTYFEKSFCSLHDVRSFQKFNIPGVQNVDFCTMSAKIDGVHQPVKLRRLSTPSYVTAAPGTPLNFYTQWVWYRQERDGTYTPYIPGTLQYTLEEKYLKGQHKYCFEFEELGLVVNTQSSQMVQTNVDTQQSTLIIRRPVFITAETSKAPRMSSLLLSEVPAPLLHQVPEHWSAVDHFQDFELVELSEAMAEYIAVQRQFFSSMDRRKHRIAHIFRVQNPGLWDKYCSARRAMTPRGQRPEEVDERQLFHGTPTLQAARGICANSFDFRRSGENVGAIHGKGAYFSTTARFSHKYTRAHTPATGAVTALAVRGAPRGPGQVSYAGPPGAESRSCRVCTVSQESPIVGLPSGAGPGAVVPFPTPKRRPCTDDSLRFMFLGRILVGQFTLGHSSYTKPPERDRLKLYDSCVNDVFNPTVFVIFDLAQSYPEYLIQYTDLADSTQQRVVTPGSRGRCSPSPGRRPRARTPGSRGRCLPSPVRRPRARTPGSRGRCSPSPVRRPRARTPGSRGRCSPSPVRRPRARTPGSRGRCSPSPVRRPRPVTPVSRGPPAPSLLASVSATTVQNYSSSVQTQIKSIKTPSTPSPRAIPSAPLAPRGMTQVSHGPPSPSSLASVSATTVQSYSSSVQTQIKSPSTPSPRAIPSAPLAPRGVTQVSHGPPSPSSLASVSATTVQNYSSNVQTQIKSNKAPSFPSLTANPSAPIAPRGVTQSVVSLSSTTLQSSPPDVRVSNNPLFSSCSLSAEQHKSSTRKRKKKNKCVIT